MRKLFTTFALTLAIIATFLVAADSVFAQASNTYAGGIVSGQSRTVTDAVTNNTTTVTSATAAFAAVDVGKQVILSGGSPATNFSSVISVVTSSTAIVLAANPGTTSTGVTAQFVGSILGNGVLKSNGPSSVGMAGSVDAVQAASAATGTVVVNPNLGDILTVTPTGAITFNVTAGSLRPNQTLTVVVTTSGTSSFVITFGTLFKTTGTLATGTVDAKVFTVTFRSDGTNYNEVSRTTAM